jgi:LPS sulfotransferase NodH
MKTPISRFVILFTGRSGSSYLSSLLNSHPNVICEGEMLAQIIYAGEPPEKQLTWSRQFFEAERPPQILCVGYKTKLSDVVESERFQGLLKELDVRVVHLVRRNLVKQVVSAMNAERLHQTTGQWNIRDEGERLGAFHADPAKFDVTLRNRVSGEKQLATSVSSLQLPTMRVDYEDLLYARDVT